MVRTNPFHIKIIYLFFFQKYYSKKTLQKLVIPVRMLAKTTSKYNFLILEYSIYLSELSWLYIKKWHTLVIFVIFKKKVATQQYPSYQYMWSKYWRALLLMMWNRNQEKKVNLCECIIIFYDRLKEEYKRLKGFQISHSNQTFLFRE